MEYLGKFYEMVQALSPEEQSKIIEDFVSCGFLEPVITPDMHAEAAAFLVSKPDEEAKILTVAAPPDNSTECTNMTPHYIEVCNCLHTGEQIKMALPSPPFLNGSVSAGDVGSVSAAAFAQLQADVATLQGQVATLQEQIATLQEAAKIAQ